MSILDKYLAPPAPAAPGDPYADALRKERDRPAVQILSREANPERAARAAQIARENGVPSITVEQNYETFEAREKARKADLIFGMYPKLGKWAQNRDYARQAADDLDGLRDVGRVFDPKEWARVHGSMKPRNAAEDGVWGALRGLWINLTGGAEEANAGLDMAIADSGAVEWVHRNIRGKSEAEILREVNFRKRDAMRRYGEAGADIAAATPRYNSFLGDSVYSGLTSVARMVPGVALSLAVRNPAPGLAVAGAQTSLPAYGKYRARGGTPGEAALGAAGEGGVEVATELLPMGKLVADFGKVGAGKFLRDYLGREMPTEQVATFAQDAIDTAIANPDKTWGEFLQERPEAAARTAIATLTSSGVLAGASYAVERIDPQYKDRLEVVRKRHLKQQMKESKRQWREQEALRRTDPQAYLAATLARWETQLQQKEAVPEAGDDFLDSTIAQATAEGMFLDKLSEAVGRMKLRDRNPDAVRELVETLAGDGPARNMYVPAGAPGDFLKLEH